MDVEEKLRNEIIDFIDFSNNKYLRFIICCCSIMENKIEVTNNKEIFDQYKNLTKRLMKFVKLTE